MEENVNRKPRLWLIGTICALIVGLPFLNKPLHIDDTLVLAVTEQIMEHPLRPLDFNFHWFDDLEPIFPKTDNPPLLSYWLAPAVAWFGSSEIVLHLWMLPFLILLAISVGSLSRRFTKASVWPVLFVMFSPAVVVSPNIMRDVPAAALATAAVALFITGTDRDKWLYVLAGGLLAGLAMVTKYSAAILLPVIALYPILRRKPKYLIGLLCALVVFELWIVQNYWVHDQLHLIAIRKDKAHLPFNWKDKLAAAMVITGASFFLVPVLVAGAVHRRDGLAPSIAAIAAVLAALLLLAHLMPFLADRVRPNTIGEHSWGMIQYNFWGLLGAIIVAWCVTAGAIVSGRWWRSDNAEARDSLFLLWWMIGPYICAIFFVGFPAVRHILPAAAPIALLAIRYAQRAEAPPRRWVGVVFGAGLALEAVLAFWTAAADYGYANSYRRFAYEAVKKYKPPKGNQIWFHGHWGWQHYAAKAGMKPIIRNIVVPGEGPKPAPAPKAGDIIVSPLVVHKGAMPPGLEERLEKIDEVRYPAKLCMTTMDWAYASFYATFGTCSPMRFTRGKSYEIFRIYRVKGQ